MVSFCEKVGPLPLPRGRTVLRLHACPSSGETRKVAPETCRRIFHPRTAEQMLALFHGLLAAVPAAASSSSPSGSLTVTCTLLAVATDSDDGAEDEDVRCHVAAPGTRGHGRPQVARLPTANFVPCVMCGAHTVPGVNVYLERWHALPSHERRLVGALARPV